MDRKVDGPSSLSSWRSTLTLRQSGFNSAAHSHKIFSHIPSLCHPRFDSLSLGVLEKTHTPQLWLDQMPHPMSFSIKTSCCVFSYKIHLVHRDCLWWKEADSRQRLKANPLTIGKRKVIPAYDPSAMRQPIFWGVFPFIWFAWWPWEESGIFSVLQVKSTEVSGVFKLREQGSRRAGMRNEAQSCCKPACVGLWCIPKNTNKGRGGLESEFPGGVYLYQCPGNCTCKSWLWSPAPCNLTGGLSRVPL